MARKTREADPLTTLISVKAEFGDLLKNIESLKSQVTGAIKRSGSLIADLKAREPKASSRTKAVREDKSDREERQTRKRASTKADTPVRSTKKKAK